VLGFSAATVNTMIVNTTYNSRAPMIFKTDVSWFIAVAKNKFLPCLHAASTGQMNSFS